MTESEKIKRLRDAFMEFGIDFSYLSDPEFLLEIAQVRVNVENAKLLKMQQEKLQAINPIMTAFQSAITNKLNEVIDRAKESSKPNRYQRRQAKRKPTDTSKLH